MKQICIWNYRTDETLLFENGQELADFLLSSEHCVKDFCYYSLSRFPVPVEREHGALAAEVDAWVNNGRQSRKECAPPIPSGSLVVSDEVLRDSARLLETMSAELLRMMKAAN